jgi:hypothetical protein
MCTPDLRGTQGTFSFYTTRKADDGEKTGGDVHHVERRGDSIAGDLLGPPHPSDPRRGLLRVPFTVTLQGAGRAALKIDGRTLGLVRGEYTGWVSVGFRAGLGVRIRGICRFLLLETSPHFELYVTPVNIDPESPAMAIGYPAVYPIYLAKRQGPYATLGLAEDTWGLSEQVLDDEHFLRQCVDIEAERESMFFDGLEKVPRGLCVCVFDGSDRMQHMFWRYLDPEHPARPAVVPPALRTAVEDMYQRIDKLVGRTMARCRGDDTLLLVISDHGFNAFRRGVDLNRWLEQNGYLAVDDARRHEPHFGGVDWSRTRAFAVGLSGIFINQRDRFEQGIVAPGDEAVELRAEIARRLATLEDSADGSPAVKRVYQAVRAYQGPYREHAPDLIVGYASGYRVSWDTAIGRTGREVFRDNTKAWSGDHCVDPSVVPGVLFCNRKIHGEHPRLLDLAATILQQFGVPIPDYMDGRPLPIGETAAAPPRAPAPEDEPQPQVA